MANDPIKRATETSKKFLEEQRRRAQQGPSQKKKTPKAGIGNLPGKKKDNNLMPIYVITSDGKEMKLTGDQFFKLDGNNVEMKAKGGRVGLKSGSKGCKLAMKGKGRAYGKNS